jgi:hypothetical protein
MLLAAAPAAADEAPAPAMDVRVARCVLRNAALARSETGAELVAAACRALVREADGDAADALVKCFVPGDPEWVEFRLLTPGQCARVAGIAGG